METHILLNSMAECSLSTVASTVLEALQSPAVSDTLTGSWGYHPKTIEELLDIMKDIKDLLKDAEEKQYTSRAIGVWLRKLGAVLYEADDLFDQIVYLTISEQFMCPGETLTCSFLSHDNNLIALSRGISQIVHSLYTLANEIHELELNPTRMPKRRVREEFVFGRDDLDKKQQMLEPLLGSHGPRVQLNQSKLLKVGRHVLSKLWNKKSPDDWLIVGDKDCESLDMLQQNNKDDVVKPSYGELSSSLKLCLAYCSLFPKDYRFMKQSLIHMWMSQGFLEPCTEHQLSLEDVGEVYFTELLRMSCFQDLVLDEFGDVISCSVAHHLAPNVGGAQSIVANSNSTNFDYKTLHMSVSFDKNFSRSVLQASKIRTLIWMHDRFFTTPKPHRSVIHMLISRFRRLRTLYLNCYDLKVLPDNIGNLIHLRYLDVSGNGSLVEIPESITKLYNLQTLNLTNCNGLKRLPIGIGKLMMLRSLLIDGCLYLTHMPLGLRKLTSLQTLDRFVAGKSCLEESNSGGIGVLNTLNNLRGKLKIELRGGQWTTFVQEAAVANLKSKSRLTSLKISWNIWLQEDLDDVQTVTLKTENIQSHYYEQLLDSLQPPSSLTELYIDGYKGNDLPSWARKDKLVSCLPNLVILEIATLGDCNYLPPFGQLKSLKKLFLIYANRVEYMEDSPPLSTPAIFFPSLEELTLVGFYNLKGWWKDIESRQQCDVALPSFEHLSKLKIRDCPKLAFLPLCPFVEELELESVLHILVDMLMTKQTSITSTSEGPTSSSSLSSAMSNGLFQSLTKLRRLHIQDSKSRSFLGLSEEVSCLQLLKSLQELELSYFKALQELELSYFEELDESYGNQQLSNLKNLQNLILNGIPKLEILPESLLHCQTLKVLKISSCKGMISLPKRLDKLSSLQHLSIFYCPMLTSLPPTISYLKNLTRLEIEGCPKLQERCSRETNGEDWPYISHIHTVSIRNTCPFGYVL